MSEWITGELIMVLALAVLVIIARRQPKHGPRDELDQPDRHSHD